MGAARMNKIRLLEPNFEDGKKVGTIKVINKNTNDTFPFSKIFKGIHSLRKTVGSNEELPNPRQIGNIMEQVNEERKQQNRSRRKEDEFFSNSVASLMFGQLITHDMTGEIRAQVIGGVESK